MILPAASRFGHHRHMRWAAILMLAIGCTGQPNLSVELRTDLRPAEEFDLVRVSITPAEPVEGFDEAEVWVRVHDYDPVLTGHRLADISGIPIGMLNLEVDAYLGSTYLQSSRLSVQF